MKPWELVLIATVAGFLHGFFFEQHPWTTAGQLKVAASRLPLITWLERVDDSIDLVFHQYVAPATNDTKSNTTSRLAALSPIRSAKSKYAVLEEKRPEMKAERAEVEPGIKIAKSLLSIDVENMSFLYLLEELGKRCHIDILGKHTLADRDVTVNFRNVELEDGLRELMRISGVENYALFYRDSAESQYSISNIIILPYDGGESKDDYVAEAEGEKNMENPFQVETQMEKDFETESKDEILAELRDDFLEGLPADILAELKSAD